MLPYFYHRVPVVRDSSVQTDLTEPKKTQSTSNEYTDGQEYRLLNGSRKHEAINKDNFIQPEFAASSDKNNKSKNRIKSKNSKSCLEANILKNENVLSEFNAHVEVIKIEDNIKLSFTVSQSSISSILSVLTYEERERCKENGTLRETLLERKSMPQQSPDVDTSNEGTDAALRVTECEEGLGDSTDSWSTISDELSQEKEIDNSSFHLELDKVQEENDLNAIVKALKADREEKDEENEATCEKIVGCNSAQQVSDNGKSSKDADIYQLKSKLEETGLQDSMNSTSPICDKYKTLQEIKSDDIHYDINLASEENKENTSTDKADVFLKRVSNDSFGNNCEHAPASSNTPTSETIAHTTREEKQNEATCVKIIGCNSALPELDTDKQSEDADVYQLKSEVGETCLQDSMKSKTLLSDETLQEINSEIHSDINLAPEKDTENTSTDEVDLVKERIPYDSFGTNCESVTASNTQISEAIVHTDCKENIQNMASVNGRKIESSLNINSSTMDELENFSSANSLLSNEHLELNCLGTIQSSSTTNITSDLKESSSIKENAENYFELNSQERNADSQSKQTKTSVGAKQDIISEKQFNCEQTFEEKNSLDVKLGEISSCIREVSCTDTSDDRQASNSFLANNGDERLELINKNKITSSISLRIESEKETIAHEINISTFSEENAPLGKSDDLCPMAIDKQNNGKSPDDENFNREMVMEKDYEQQQIHESIASIKESNEILSSTLKNIEKNVENSKVEFLNVSLNSEHELSNLNEMNESYFNVTARSENSFETSSLSNGFQNTIDKIHLLEEFVSSSDATDNATKSSNNGIINQYTEVDLVQMKETKLIPVDDEESSDDSFIMNQLSEKVETPPANPVAHNVELNDDSFSINDSSLHERTKSMLRKSAIVTDEESNKNTINESAFELDKTTSVDVSKLGKTSSFNASETMENIDEGKLLEQPKLRSSMTLRESNEIRKTVNNVIKTNKDPDENLSKEQKVCSTITQECNEIKQTNENGDKELKKAVAEKTKKLVNIIKSDNLSYNYNVSNKSTESEAEKILIYDTSTESVVDHLQCDEKSSEIKTTVKNNRALPSNMNGYLATKQSEKDSSNFMNETPVKDINQISTFSTLQSDDSGVEEAGIEDKDVTPKVLKRHDTFFKSNESLSSSNVLRPKAGTSELSNENKTELKAFSSETSLDILRSTGTFPTSESISESKIRENNSLANDGGKTFNSGNHYESQRENDYCKVSVKELNSSLNVLTEKKLSISNLQSQNLNDTASFVNDRFNDNRTEIALNKISTKKIETRNKKITNSENQTIDIHDEITEENHDDFEDTDYHEAEKNSTFTVTPDKESDVALNSFSNKELATTSENGSKIEIQNSVDEIDVAPTRERPKLFRHMDRSENIIEEIEGGEDRVQKANEKSYFKQSEKMSLPQGSSLKKSIRCKSEEPELKSKLLKPIEQRRRSAELSRSDRTNSASKMGTQSKNVKTENGNSVKNASKGMKIIKETTIDSFVEDISAQTKRSTRKTETKSIDKSHEKSTPAKIIRAKNIQSMENKGSLDTVSSLNAPEKKQRSKNVKLDIETKESENELSEASNPEDNSTPRKNKSRVRTPMKKLTLSTEKGSLDTVSSLNTPEKKPRSKNVKVDIESGKSENELSEASIPDDKSTPRKNKSRARTPAMNKLSTEKGSLNSESSVSTPKKRQKPKSEEFSSENELSEASNPDVKNTPLKTKSRVRAAGGKNASIRENFGTPDKSTRSKTIDSESVCDDSLRRTRRTRVTKN